MQQLPFSLDRTVVINASRDAVFKFFTDSARWASWWGAGSTIEATPGGKVYIRFHEGTEIAGEVLEVKAPERIVFSYGYLKGGPLPAGGSKVTIHLEADRFATRLRLVHEFDNEASRNEHVQGWRYQLSLFSNVVADEVNAGAADIADAWFESWAEPDAGARKNILDRIVQQKIRFHDRYSNIDGLDELLPHIAAAQHFMPGLRMSRVGEVRHCQGTVLADFTVAGPDGIVRGSGTNVFVFGADGRIESATGFMNKA